jgi:SAM-dependent methyltransferase
MTMPTDLDARVKRERAAHTEDDVLARSHQLKDRFPHIRTYVGLKRLNDEMTRLLCKASGKQVLDLGCGRGERSLKLLQCGANVSGIDISPVYVAQTVEAALAAGFKRSRFEFRVMDAHHLDFPDNMFDLIVGEGILHHLDLIVSTNELLRALKPEGRALFKEPLRDNPLLKLFRKLTPNARTIDERPLSRADLALLANNPHWRIESSYCGLLSAPAAVVTSFLLRPWPNNVILTTADWIEQLLANVRWLDPLHQYVLLNVVKCDAPQDLIPERYDELASEDC